MTAAVDVTIVYNQVRLVPWISLLEPWISVYKANVASTHIIYAGTNILCTECLFSMYGVDEDARI